MLSVSARSVGWVKLADPSSIRYGSDGAVVATARNATDRLPRRDVSYPGTRLGSTRVPSRTAAGVRCPDKGDGRAERKRGRPEWADTSRGCRRLVGRLAGEHQGDGHPGGEILIDGQNKSVEMLLKQLVSVFSAAPPVYAKPPDQPASPARPAPQVQPIPNGPNGSAAQYSSVTAMPASPVSPSRGGSQGPPPPARPFSGTFQPVEVSCGALHAMTGLSSPAPAAVPRGAHAATDRLLPSSCPRRLGWIGSASDTSAARFYARVPGPLVPAPGLARTWRPFSASTESTSASWPAVQSWVYA